MTSFRIERLPLTGEQVSTWALTDRRYQNWPVVYTLDGRGEIYVGESLNAAGRLRQHLANVDKQRLAEARVVIDDTFNKSVCLDLESYLIRLLAGDGQYQVLNRNEGITDADYYGRDNYRRTFQQIFEQLRAEGGYSPAQSRRSRTATCLSCRHSKRSHPIRASSS